jgi:hypothetical protein
LDPKWWTALIRHEFTAMVLNVLLKAAMSKGNILPFEIRRNLQLAYQDICGELLPENTIQKALQSGAHTRSMWDLVGKVQPSLPRKVRKRMIRGAVRVADIEGTITPNQRLLIRELKRALRSW